MILLIGHYNEAHKDRAAEMAECLRRNCEVDRFEQIHVFLEDETRPAPHPKLKMVPFGHRLRFADLFRYANYELVGQACIIANSDIYFDDTLGELVGFDLKDKLLCVSRWETLENGQVVNNNYSNSHDAWIFRSPIRTFPSDWYLGLLASDTRLAFEARRAGLTCLNPCQSIHAVHLHLTGVHNYTRNDWVLGPQAVVPGQQLRGPAPVFRPGPGKGDRGVGVPLPGIAPISSRNEALPMGCNPRTALQNGLLPIVNLNRKF